MIVVDYVSPVEFRSPPRYGILVPYLVLFFGSILLMGIPMFRLNRGLWMVTVASTVLLLKLDADSRCERESADDRRPFSLPPCCRSARHPTSASSRRPEGRIAEERRVRRS